MSKVKCAVIRCAFLHHSKGLCRNHYMKAKRAGWVCELCGVAIQAGQFCTPEHALIASKRNHNVAIDLLSDELDALAEQLLLSGDKLYGRVRLLQAILRTTTEVGGAAA